jgi:hypothetical protein
VNQQLSAKYNSVEQLRSNIELALQPHLKKSPRKSKQLVKQAIQDTRPGFENLGQVLHLLHTSSFKIRKGTRTLRQVLDDVLALVRAYPQMFSLHTALASQADNTLLGKPLHDVPDIGRALASLPLMQSSKQFVASNQQ